ncbi:hypothetical protein QBC34DRAFT_494293 [Podospora aff. communis PSN243]|uniref:DUF6546 domain-containing protein n=1 Tax=Podospora aff. communis PSN243 TaxID=3040156 RepID=A0AAV9GNT0_9PEZI|nr:hypothetical protein QBC34DRAFT_494293 [Podospora aff. communis PSN243]
MSWSRLPVELRLMTLEFLKPAIYLLHRAPIHRFPGPEDYADTFRPQDPYVWARYASVCRDWQYFFEPMTFRDILLDQDRIADFDRFASRVPERRSYIVNIHLRVKLPDYDCSTCQLEEDEESRKKNNVVLTQAMQDLLATLSKWPAPQPHRRHGHITGIWLDLSTLCPNDYQHGIRDFALQPNYPILFCQDQWADYDLDFPAEEERKAQLDAEPFHDPSHGWVNGQQSAVSLAVKKRVTESLVLLSDALPIAPVVTHFAILRQSSRGINPNSLKKLFVALPNLRHFTHEPRLAVTAERQQLFTSSYLPHPLPRQFTALDSALPEDQLTRESKRDLARALSKAIQNIPSLVRLAASFIVDAYDFFDGFDAPLSNPQTWDYLRDLTLTSSRLSPVTPGWERQQVLVRAGRAAAFMPNLEDMILWNGGQGFGYYLQYRESGPKTAVLLLVSTFPSAGWNDMSPEVIAAWSGLRRRAGVLRDLHVAVEPFADGHDWGIRGVEHMVEELRFEFVAAARGL